MSTKRVVYFFDRNDSLEHDFKTGIILCGSCRLMWCVHMWDMMKSEEALDLFWDAPGEQDSLIVIVPIVPTIGVFVRYQLNWIPSLDAYSIWFFQNMDGALSDQIEDGYLSRGEGLPVLRQSFYDYVDIWVHDDLVCPSMSHSFSNNVRFQANLSKGGATLLAEKASIWRQNACTVCIGTSAASAGGDNNLDDLIPEEESAGRNPFKP